MGYIGTGQAFTALIHQALRAYGRDDDLASLTQLAELATIQALTRRRPGLSSGAAVREWLDVGLAGLAQTDAQAADLLIRRFVKREFVAEIARTRCCSERHLYELQEQALVALSRGLWEAEEAARQSIQLTQAQEAALATLPPPTANRLFGVTEILARLNDFLAAEDAYWIVAIDGMGGIGKTALARASVEASVRSGRFTQAAWITARRQYFAWGRMQCEDAPAMLTWTDVLAELRRHWGLRADPREDVRAQERQVRTVLSQQPSVIVLDNLETATDVQALMAGLERLARPVKILLTARQRVSAYEGATVLTLRELGREDALSLIHYQARERNVPAVLNASPAELERIVEVTGGSPLAIKLVLGQMHARPLVTVMDELASVVGDARDLYRFIFAYSWERLSPGAQRLLLHMPLLDARGTGWQELAAISGTPPDEHFWRAIEELVASSLLNAGYARGQLLYSIHRLTEHFILSDLVQP